MFKNDNDRKTLLFALLCTLLLFVFAACGRQMSALTGGAGELASRLCEKTERELDAMSESEITGREAYLLGISEQEFEESVAEARFYSASELSAGKSLCVVVAKSEYSAAALCERMFECYDWAPCDPDEAAAFMHFGRYVLFAKDSEREVERICLAFSEMTAGQASVRLSQNPM